VQQPLVEQKFMMIGATVFAHQTSKIQWYEDGIFHESLVGWDLNALTGVGDFLYKGAQYSLLMAISNEDNADAPEISQAGPDGVVPLPVSKRKPIVWLRLRICLSIRPLPFGCGQGKAANTRSRPRRLRKLRRRLASETHSGFTLHFHRGDFLSSAGRRRSKPANPHSWDGRGI
jgi:hypothetical protein